MAERFGVLFVCLGNICRSPLAEAIFLESLAQQGISDRFTVASCGTGNWHQGDGADPRSIEVGKTHGLSLLDHRARQVRRDDFSDFHLIVAMDRSNLSNLERLKGDSQSELILLRNYDPEDTDPDVPDPYSGGPEGFETVYQMIKRCCDRLLEDLLTRQP